MIDFDIREYGVVVSGDQRFLGKLVKPTAAALLQSVRRPHATPSTFDLDSPPLEMVFLPDVIALSPVFELLTMTGQTPSGAVTRNALVSPVDVAVAGCPLYLRLNALYLCVEMVEEDLKTYAELVRQGHESQARSRAARAGIQLAGSVPGIAKGGSR